MAHICVFCQEYDCDCGNELCLGCSFCIIDNDPIDWIEPDDYIWDDDPKDPKEGD